MLQAFGQNYYSEEYLMTFDARDLHRAHTLDELLAKQAQFLAKNAPHRFQFLSDSRPAVYLNLARWLVDCPHCGNGCAVLESAAACFSCGAQFKGLERPAAESAIVAVVMLRPSVGHRNWRPSESVADLIDQNIDRGDPVPAGGTVMDGGR
jgi:hypothetical protein